MEKGLATCIRSPQLLLEHKIVNININLAKEDNRIIAHLQVPEAMVGSNILGSSPRLSFPAPMVPGLDVLPPSDPTAPLLEGSVLGGEGRDEGPATPPPPGNPGILTVHN